jgi:hypothetical protein
MMPYLTTSVPKYVTYTNIIPYFNTRHEFNKKIYAITNTMPITPSKVNGIKITGQTLQSRYRNKFLETN